MLSLTLPQKAMLIVQSTVQKDLFKPIFSAHFICLNVHASIGMRSPIKRNSIFASCMFQPMKSMALWRKKPLPLLKHTVTNLIARIQPVKHPVTILSVLITTRTVFRYSQPIVRITMGLINSPKNWSH